VYVVWPEVTQFVMFYLRVKSIYVVLTFALKASCCGQLGNWSVIGLLPESVCPSGRLPLSFVFPSDTQAHTPRRA